MCCDNFIVLQAARFFYQFIFFSPRTCDSQVMMDCGEIILDIDAAEKAKLSTADIVRRFKSIKKKELANDEILLGS
jgi:hypothetical protein